MSGIVGSAGSKSGVIGITELDYEEGTWTPGVLGASVTGGNWVAHYTKIGNRVLFNWYSSSVTYSSASGDAIITGLPFTASNDSNNYSPFHYVHGNAVDGDTRGGAVYQNATTMKFFDKNGQAGSTFNNGASKYMMISGQYFTDI